MTNPGDDWPIRGRPPQRAAAPVKRAAAKKPVVKQSVGKQPLGKQPVVKRPVAKKAAVKRATPKKAVVQRPVPRKSAARKTAARKTVAKKTGSPQTALRQTAIPRQHSRAPQRAPQRVRPAPRPPRAPRRPLLPAARVGDPNRRLRIALSVVMVVLLIFGGRLVQLQGINGPGVAATALASRQTSQDLPAHRGDILDNTGATLATTVERRNITVDQRLVPEYRMKDDTAQIQDQGVPGAARALAPILGMNAQAVQQKITGDRPFAYVVKNIEPDIWRQVARLGIPGIFSQEASRRNYPGGQVAATVVGFLNNAGVPQGGIESSMQNELKGTNGELTYERGKGGQQIATGLSSETEPVAGDDVQLTINQDLQWKTTELLADQVRATGSESGQAVVMDPRTGNVYALVSVPTYDPNDPGATPIGDLQDRAVTYGFEPGSTSKVITAAAALQEGVATPSTKLSVDGTINRGGKIFHDSHAHGVEKLTFAGVIAQSSNVGTIHIGEKLSPATMYDYLRKFGIGSKTGIGLGEISGTLAPYTQWSNSQRYTVLFGQGLSVTALQSASVFATIANNGVRVTPRIVQAVSGPTGDLVPTPASAQTRVVSAQTATTLRTMLEKVVSDDGTAVEASVPGYRVAGKTGTAQAYDEKCGCYRGYTASFVGMAPADNPRLVVAIYLQKPVRNYFGGTSAAPVFQQVMTYGLAHLDIEPSDTKPPNVPQTWK